MTPDLPAALLHEGLMTLATVGAPLFLSVLAVGLLVGVLQSATQVNDAAVSFLPRALTASVVLLLAGSWMASRLAAFLAHCILRMSER